MMRRSAALAFVLFLALGAGSPSSARASSFSVLDFYRDEVARLVDSPGGSSSIAAGLVNPAAWRIQDRGGLFLALDDRAVDGDLKDFRAALSLRNLGFGVRRLARGPDDWYDYTIGLGFGSRRSATAISYSWVKGADEVFGDSQRISAGWIYRLPWLSLGTLDVYDFSVERHVTQADLGVRPWGPRWTLFTDIMATEKNFDYRDVQWGYGLQAQLMPGVELGVRGADDGSFGLRVEVGLGQLRPSARYRVDNDGDRIASTLALEARSGTDLLRSLGVGAEQRDVAWRGTLGYRTYEWFDSRPKMLSLLAQVDAWATDPRVERVVLDLSGFRASAANLWELRSQLAGLREQGKTIVVHFDRLGMSGYMLASVADELWMDPMGNLDLRGINFGRTYYKRALEKLGVGFEEWRFFEYKSAVETYSRTSFSEPDREQWAALLEDFYETLANDLRDGRGISREELDRILDEKGILSATEAEALGLVDAVGDLSSASESALDVPPRPGSDSHVAALGRLFGDPRWVGSRWGRTPRIALLYAIGPTEMESGIEGRRLARLIRQVRQDPDVRAVVLRADSPGGDPLPSDLVARELRETAAVKPVIVSQGQVAGSGGYWISMFGNSILASPLTVTGSIGVISGHLYDDGIGDKIGMDYDHLQVGRSADLQAGPALPLLGVQVPHRPSTPDERARAEELIRELYANFVGAVAAGRSMSVDEVEKVAQGRIFSGLDGLDAGLVDEIGGLWQSLLRAKEAAGLRPEDPIQLVTGPSLGRLPKWWLRSSLLSLGLRGSTDGAARILSLADKEPAGPESVERVRLRPSLLDDLSILEKVYLEQILRRSGRPATVMVPMGLGEWLPSLD